MFSQWVRYEQNLLQEFVTGRKDSLTVTGPVYRKFDTGLVHMKLFGFILGIVDSFFRLSGKG